MSDPVLLPVDHPSISPYADDPHFAALSEAYSAVVPSLSPTLAFSELLAVLSVREGVPDEVRALAARIVFDQFQVRFGRQVTAAELARALPARRPQRFTRPIPIVVSPNVEAHVERLGGIQARKIHKVLIANNGMAAVKGTLWIRKWAYENLGDERAIEIVAMATPEDIDANAEFIRLADRVVEVPGGDNYNNYKNVGKIVEVATQERVDAVWPGWGHAAEDHALPKALAQAGIIFMGPSEHAMKALGDKIASMIIAQSIGIPVLHWSGNRPGAEDRIISISPERIREGVPDDLYEQATVASVEEAVGQAGAIGWPVMVKASGTGGGRGMREAKNAAELRSIYSQVVGESVGSRIFVMKKASDRCRHVEVQIFGDLHGNVASLFTRDCSVQRRKQKIIEEGPAVIVPEEIRLQMEAAAVRLGNAVGYHGAGTVEFLYDPDTAQFHFLELNSRLQVEHPVTEGITGLNLLGLQLSVSMGIPLHRIPEIRNLYGKDPSGADPIDFEKERREIDTHHHVLAVRITAEDANAGFSPTTGLITELSFRSMPGVWGYFSVGRHGKVHQYADSQIGHIFAKGTTREEARLNMVYALRNLTIRGEIRTNREYLIRLLESGEFKADTHNITWLDQLIEGKKTAEPPEHDLAIIAGALYRGHLLAVGSITEYVTALKQGRSPPASLLANRFQFEMIYGDQKYPLVVTRTGDSSYTIRLNDSLISATVKPLAGGGLRISVGGKNHVIYAQEDVIGLHLEVDGKSCSFGKESDPSQIRLKMPGRFKRFAEDLNDGDQVTEGQVIGIFEASKMEQPLKAEAAGIIRFRVAEDSTLEAGTVIAEIELDNPALVRKADLYTKGLAWGRTAEVPVAVLPSPLTAFRESFTVVRGIMAGYGHPPEVFDQELNGTLNRLWTSLSDRERPLLELDEVLGNLSGRIPESVEERIRSLIGPTRRFLSLDRKEQAGELSPAIGSALRALVGEGGDYTALLSQLGDSSVFRRIVPVLVDLMTAQLPAPHGDFFAARRAELVAAVTDELLTRNKIWSRNPQVVVSTVIESILWFSVRLSLTAHETTLQDKDKKSFQNVSKQLADLAFYSSGGNETRHDRAIAFFLSTYLSVEEAFDAVGSEEEVLRKLRDDKDKLGGWDKVYEIVRSHHLAAQRKAVVLGILEHMVTARNADTFLPLLARLAALKKDNYREVALKARQVIQRRGDRSRGERSEDLRQELESLSRDGNGDEGLMNLVDRAEAYFDILTPFFWEDSPELRDMAIQLFIHRAYRAYDITHLEQKMIVGVQGLPVAQWRYGFQSSGRKGQSRRGYFVVFPSFDEMDTGGLARFIRFLASTRPPTAAGLQGREDEPVNSVTVALPWAELDGRDDNVAQRLATVVEKVKTSLPIIKAGRITFLVTDGKSFPRFFTYRKQEDGSFLEDKVYRGINPPQAFLLELARMRNFDIAPYDSGNQRIHLFYGVGRRGTGTASTPKRKEDVDRRFFVRAIIRSAPFTSSAVKHEGIYVPEEVDRVFSEALDSLEMAVRDPRFERTDWNEIFLNILPDFTLGPDSVEKIIRALAHRHADRLRRLRVSEVEVKVRMKLASDRNIPRETYRFVASNPTGYVLTIDRYQEVEWADGDVILESRGSEVGPLDNTNIRDPYPELDPLQRKKIDARRRGTTYVYELPDLFETAVNLIWKERAGESAAATDIVPVERVELILDERDELVETTRPEGQNDIGMVAWRLTLRTLEYPHGRSVILIANDFTHENGTFGPREDRLYRKASELARREGIPRLFVSANSGARFDLNPALKKKIQVAFTDEQEIARRKIRYIYLTEADQKVFEKDVVGEWIDEAGERRFKVTGVIAIPGGNQENLRGSGEIARETSLAYEETFTLTYVMGLTVGIGAYVTRLGQRVIQKRGASIILTGKDALNLLLGGEEVYVSNEEVGGADQIMLPNGVAHLGVDNDLQGVTEILHWLSYVPAVRGGDLPIIHSQDPVDRKISYAPIADTPYDPRWLLQGQAGTETTAARTGFFDEGSFREVQKEWGKTVVAGRARLGGIPVGVIAVETREMERVIPPDPADKAMGERREKQAGKVWYPDSAYKTAQAISDLNGEGLPLFIFANWIGFSGGTRDMFEEVLKFGSMIVDNLRKFNQPVFIYLPPFAELRGGAWVVVDPQINPDMIEMTADPTARGGVLEAKGIIGFKFKWAELVALMHRLDPELKRLDGEMQKGRPDRTAIERQIKEREKSLGPLYKQVALQFADLHDVPERMVAVGAMNGIVPWEDSRATLHARLVARLQEKKVSDRIRAVYPELEPDEVKGLVRECLGMDEGDREDFFHELALQRVRDLVEQATMAAPSAAIAGALAALMVLPPERRAAAVDALRTGLELLTKPSGGSEGGGAGAELMGRAFGWTHPTWEEARSAVQKGIEEGGFDPSLYWRDSVGRIFQIGKLEKVGPKTRLTIDQIVPDLAAPERIPLEEFEQAVLGRITAEFPLTQLVKLRFAEYGFSGQDFVVWEKKDDGTFRRIETNNFGSDARRQFAELATIAGLFGLTPSSPRASIYAPHFRNAQGGEFSVHLADGGKVRVIIRNEGTVPTLTEARDRLLAAFDQVRQENLLEIFSPVQTISIEVEDGSRSPILLTKVEQADGPAFVESGEGEDTGGGAGPGAGPVPAALADHGDLPVVAPDGAIPLSPGDVVVSPPNQGQGEGEGTGGRRDPKAFSGAQIHHVGGVDVGDDVGPNGSEVMSNGNLAIAVSPSPFPLPRGERVRERVVSGFDGSHGDPRLRALLMRALQTASQWGATETSVTLRRLLTELERGRNLGALVMSREKFVGFLRERGYRDLAEALSQSRVRLMADQILVMRIAILQKDERTLEKFIERLGGAPGLPVVQGIPGIVSPLSIGRTAPVFVIK